MNRMFVRGDTHGDFDFLPYFCQEHSTTKNDLLVILGDAGILYYGAKSLREKRLKQYLAEQPITLFCVRGNHEDRPEGRGMTYAYSDLVDGKVYFENAYPNILYAKDGAVYHWNGKSILTIGGAYSVDKFYRCAMGWYWNPTEQLTESEMDAITQQHMGKYYDYVFTHTCPFAWQPTDLFLSGVDQTSIDNSMEIWMGDFSRKVDFGHWYFGHFHADRLDVCHDEKVSMLFNKDIEIV